MPWNTPTLRKVRELARDEVSSAVGGRPMVGNNVLRVMADCMAAMAHLVLRYLDWLALQPLPDTADEDWLIRHGEIWLGGRKLATTSQGVARITGAVGATLPQWARLSASGEIVGEEFLFETVREEFIGDGGYTDIDIRAVTPGAGGNLRAGVTMSFEDVHEGIDGGAVVQTDFIYGTDTELVEELRVRVLQRIREPPQGGAAHDYVRWTLEVPGVTRAWVAPLEMGMGTVTVRFMMDDLRADPDPMIDGFPILEDVVRVQEHLDEKRPVAVKDLFVEIPLKQKIDIRVQNLIPDTPSVRAEIRDALLDMLYEKAKPGQTIYGPWKQQAIMNAPSVISFTTPTTEDDVMASNGHMAVLGDIVYG